jgi:nicotinamide mononucleotide transporter
VAVVLYSYIFYEAKLYSEVGLQIYYVIVQIYGWIHWLRGGARGSDLPVTRQTSIQNAAWISATATGTLALGYTMATYTDASLPYADAFATIAALVAQWLLARKKLESWLFWIVIDLVSVRNYWIKELHVTTGLYVVLLVLATMGYFAWRKSMRADLSARAENAEAVA